MSPEMFFLKSITKPNMQNKTWKFRSAALLLALTAPLILSACTGLQGEKLNQEEQENSSVFVFEESVHEFGVLKQSSGISSHEFPFTYTGEEEISVTSTPGSCACTKAEISQKTFKKGESGVLTVHFNPNLHSEPLGRFSKTVSLFTDPKLSPIPEVTVWQEIDLDLGEEFFELSGMKTTTATDHHNEVPETNSEHQEDSEDHSGDHGTVQEIAHDGKIDPLKEVKGIRKFEMIAQEMNAPLAEGVDYFYWTFGDTVPGPFLRARVGETLQVTLKNPAENHMSHSIDLHAVNGPHGGATEVYPGESKSFTFKALTAGAFVYHCATPSVAEHMANGMYGLIVIEPADGFSAVDREYYVMQGEIYSVLERGQKGSTHLSGKKLNDEQPEYIVFNGRTGALVGDRALKAEVGEKIRLFVGNGGVSKVSSFHVIGEIFDTVYPEGGAPVHHDVQTTIIPAGGSTIVEFTVNVPGTYKLVDHALARLEKGAVAELVVTGEKDDTIYKQLD